MKCIKCGQENVIEKITSHTFQYGNEDNPPSGGVVLLTTEIPMMICNGCHTQWTDHRAEEINDAARKHHIGNIEIIEEFVQINALAIDEDGIFPPNALVEHEDGRIDIHALMSEVPDAMRHMLTIFVNNSPLRMIFGFDRHLKDDQGTTLRDGLSVTFFDGKQWRFGIMEYQNEPRIIKPINWDNESWQTMLLDELNKFQSKVRKEISDKQP